MGLCSRGHSQDGVITTPFEGLIMALFEVQLFGRHLFGIYHTANIVGVRSQHTLVHSFFRRLTVPLMLPDQCYLIGGHLLLVHNAKCQVSFVSMLSHVIDVYKEEKKNNRFY